MTHDLGPHASLLDDDGYRLVSEAVAEAKGLTMTKALAARLRDKAAWPTNEEPVLKKAHDVRHLAPCFYCDGIGDDRRMIARLQRIHSPRISFLPSNGSDVLKGSE